MSLVEMLVALLVLGVILAAFASSLVSFSKMSVLNERRAQASAFLGSLHEELQSVRWPDAGNYENELADLAALGADLATDPPTLNAEPIVVIPGPDGDRSQRVPVTSGTRVVDGRTYEFFQAVTWDTSTPVEETMKRFTTLARWTVGETTYEQLFESTRAGTPSEVDVRVAPEIRRFEVEPGEVNLDEQHRNLSRIEVEVVFNRGVTSADLTMTAVPDEENGNGEETQQFEEHTLELDPLDYVDARPVSFVGAVEVLEHSFAPGDWNFTAVGRDGSDEIVGVRTARFVVPCVGEECEPEDAGENGEEDGDANGEQGEVATPVIDDEDIIVSDYSPKIGAKHDDDGRFCGTLTVTVFVDDLVEDAVVTLSYLGEDTDTRVTMKADADSITGSRDLFSYTFEEGSDSPWRPARHNDVEDRFRITAKNPGGERSPTARSEPVTFSTNSNEMC